MGHTNLAFKCERVLAPFSRKGTRALCEVTASIHVGTFVQCLIILDCGKCAETDSYTECGFGCHVYVTNADETVWHWDPRLPCFLPNRKSCTTVVLFFANSVVARILFRVGDKKLSRLSMFSPFNFRPGFKLGDVLSFYSGALRYGHSISCPSYQLESVRDGFPTREAATSTGSTI